MAELKKLIKEKEYYPKHVFHCNETGLFWEKMPDTICIHKSAKDEPGHKTWKDRLTLELCGKAAEHRRKPGVVYRVKNRGFPKQKQNLSAHVLAT